MITMQFDSKLGWQVRYKVEELTAMSELEKVNLVVALKDFEVEVQAMIDMVSAEGQLHREVARRVNNLAASAQAAGKMSEMWSNQNSRFYKQRVIIQQGLA